MQWQPIETAPKDSTAILLWSPHSYLEYDPPPVPFVGVYSHESYNGKHYWNLAHYCAYGWEPTHWMPLPGAPSND